MYGGVVTAHKTVCGRVEFGQQPDAEAVTEMVMGGDYAPVVVAL
jgi:hypothetical protein